jgi:hypothetical protein
MNEADLRHDLRRASADISTHADPQELWSSGTRLRRRRQVMVVAGAAVATAAIAVTSMAVQALDSAAPDPPPATTSPTPPDHSVDAPTPPDNSVDSPGSIPYVTEDQVQPQFDPADLESVPWDAASAVRSWDPVDPVPLAENPVEHAAVAVQSDYDEPDAITVLGDDGRWRSLDVSDVDFSHSYEYDLGLTRGSLSPDGTQLALGQLESVVVIDLTSGARRTFDVPGLGARYQGREVFWSPDATTVYVSSTAATPARAVDLATGDTVTVPFEPGASAFLTDGRVVEHHWSGRAGYAIRVYDADGDRVFRSSNTDNVLGWLQYISARDDRWVAQRVSIGWTSEDPRGPNAPTSGVLIMNADARPEALLPVKGYNANGGGGAVFGWRGDDTVLFRIYRLKAPAAVLAWNVESGRITRIADYHMPSSSISVVADYLPAQ